MDEQQQPAARVVCHCFGHTAADIRAGRREDGSNAVVESITQACRRGLGRCAEKNPSGRCCLAEVRALAQQSATSAQCCGD